MTYAELLKLLLPYGVYSDSGDVAQAKDLSIHAGAIEACQTNADALLNEIFPDVTNALLEDWERVYGLTQEDKPLFQRLQNLSSALNARNGMSVSHIQAALKPFIGYDVDVEEYAYFWSEESFTSDDGSDVEFYAGDEDTIFTFDVIIDQAKVITDGFDPIRVQDLIYMIKPAHTNGLLSLGGDGFYSEDDASLTELTLTSDI